MKLKKKFQISLFLLLLSGVAGQAYAALPPCPDNLVCDFTGTMTKDQVRNVSDYHEALLRDYDIDLRVIVTNNAGDIAQKARDIFKGVDIGSTSKTRKGVLLLIDPAQNKVRMEISAGLDAVFTDGFVRYLEERQMVPFFQAGQVANGVMATTELIVERTQKAEDGEEFMPPDQVPEQLAIGAGAQTSAHIGGGYTAPVPAQTSNVDAKGLTPEQVVESYHQSLAEGNAAANLDIFSSATQELRKKWVITKAQMRTELNTYKNCIVQRSPADMETGIAVVYYEVEKRKCAPYFLVLEEGEWKLDFVTMMEVVRFNNKNEFHFVFDRPPPHLILFNEWRLNKDGYPWPAGKQRWGVGVADRGDVTWVSQIYYKTPAETMGLKPRDVILQWGAMKRPSAQEVWDAMESAKAGAPADVIFLRGGQTYKMTLIAPPQLED
ncbi:MAG: TPM domain-containing protein [Pseudobdellovibrionaceae bacterium]